MNAQRALAPKAETGPVPAYENRRRSLTPDWRRPTAVPEFEYDVPAVVALLGTSFDAALTVDEQGKSRSKVGLGTLYQISRNF